MSDHDITAKCTRQLAGLQDKLSQVRAGLLELQHEAAAQTMTPGNDNAMRAAYAQFEQRLKALAELCV